ncbi:MAG TPA: GNAT family N-acetyltransferase [Acidimicrobiales bacterium]|nr:GNAT family N-acetyltransferase [Acidimicrobiales bacterium]
MPVTVRRLRPGDEAVLAHLARHNDRFGSMEDRTELEPLLPGDASTFLADDRTATFVAFAGEDPVGFLYACELYRRHTVLRHLCIYEVGVSDRHRNQGIGPALLAAVGDHARTQGIERGFVVTHTSNQAAMALHAAAGGQRTATDEAVFAFTWT